MTHVAAQGVETGPVTTETRAPGTFVNIDTLVLVGGEGEARLTAALEAASNVSTVSVTADIELPALVDIPAVPASDIQAVAGGTLTVETARGVDTLSQTRAWVEAGSGALIAVHTLVRITVKLVARLAVAPEAAQGVHAGPVLADSLRNQMK